MKAFTRLDKGGVESERERGGWRSGDINISNWLCCLHQSTSTGRWCGHRVDFDIFIWDLISSLFIFYQKLSLLPKSPPSSSPPISLLPCACYPSCDLTLICFSEEYKPFITLARPRHCHAAHFIGQ